MNFKEEFLALNDVVADRHRVRIAINEAKHEYANSIKQVTSADSPIGPMGLKRLGSQHTLKPLAYSQDKKPQGRKKTQEEVKAEKVQRGYQTIVQLTDLKKKQFEQEMARLKRLENNYERDIKIMQ